MQNMLLFHNSDMLFDSLKPPTDTKPLFYWYADRFCSILGPQKYLYFFAFNPKRDGIELRSRTEGLGFSDLHKQYLEYEAFCEGERPDITYEEAGIVMSFSEMKPVLILEFDGSGKHKVLGAKGTFEIFDSQNKPIKFTALKEIVELIPDINMCLPIANPKQVSNGDYRYDDWLPMESKMNGTWL
ncbi:MAG: hypothetical protein JWO41_355 [Candidatus Saccharibacteria bacterium]|nr:hypothetical protein [Candidatus Saccharibacteria bacterium]